MPVAVHSSLTSVPPFAEPLHWVIVAPLVVAGNGSQLLAMPPPDPTHWFTVAAVAPVLSPTNLFVTLTLQRSVPPPPLIEPLHWLTDVTSVELNLVVMAHAAAGAPAAP